METIIKKIDKNKIDEQVIEEAGQILRKGGLVAFPTETVYGLGADALNEEAAGKTYAAKGRPSDNPLIIHIADISYPDKIVSDIPKKAMDLAGSFLAGTAYHDIQKVGDSSVWHDRRTGNCSGSYAGRCGGKGIDRSRRRICFGAERKYVGKTEPNFSKACGRRYGRTH